MFDERNYQTTFEVRASEDEKGAPVVTGLVVPYGVETVVGGKFAERFEKGSFRALLASAPKRDYKALFNHDPNQVLGAVQNATLRLWEEDDGLRAEFSPPDTTAGRDVLTLLRGNYVGTMSVAFKAKGDGEKWTRRGDGLPLRSVISANDMRDISVTTWAQYGDSTWASVREEIDAETLETLEAISKEEADGVLAFRRSQLVTLRRR